MPLRAGGGTRIKILEAFSQHRPVVSTGIGAEGLDVRQERELLLADTPDDFAAQCLRLIHDTELSASLTGRAARLLDERYTGVALDSVLARLLRSPGHARKTHPQPVSLRVRAQAPAPAVPPCALPVPILLPGGQSAGTGVFPL